MKFWHIFFGTFFSEVAGWGSPKFHFGDPRFVLKFYFGTSPLKVLKFYFNTPLSVKVRHFYDFSLMNIGMSSRLI